MERIIALVLKNTDNRIRNEMRVDKAFLFCRHVLVSAAAMARNRSGAVTGYYDAWLAMNDVLDEEPAFRWLIGDLTTLLPP